MPNKPEDNIRKNERAGRDLDTSSDTQPLGAQHNASEPNRGNQKMPHERDESARSTGNRLDESLPPSEQRISQAQRDIAKGLVDTERRGVPSDVPGGRK